MNRKEFLKLVAISPVALVINRLSGIFKSDEIKVTQKITKWTHSWKLQLPFGTIFAHRYQWGKKEYTAYRIRHELEGENSQRWIILPESGMVVDMAEGRYLDISQEDADRYIGIGKKWIPGHFEDI